LALSLFLVSCGLLPNTSAEFEGLYAVHFELSSFVPIGQGCPGYGIGYWLQAEPASEFFKRYEVLRLQAGTHTPPQDSLAGVIVRVRFIGRLSPPGQYGLDQYSREVTVEKLLDMTVDNSCPQIMTASSSQNNHVLVAPGAT
jgi:hypothetical protein